MSKMAVFVEGYTELLFVEKLINVIAAENTVVIETRQMSGKRALVLRAAPQNNSGKRFFTILDCRNDDLVKTRMLKEYRGLAQSGYERVICVRDLYPRFTLSELPRFEREIKFHVPTTPMPVDFILGVMEAEAWFLAEHTHFGRLDESLTCDAIVAAMNFDPRTDDMSQRLHPADDLDKCYKLCGKTYLKGNDTQVSMLDFEHVYLAVASKFRHLKRLCDVIDNFLSAASA